MIRNTLQRVISGICFYNRAKTIYDIHSPYLFELLSFCDDAKRIYYDFNTVESYRTIFLHDQRLIEKEDYGAGSSVTSDTASISQIAKSALSGKYQLQFLYRLILLKRPNVIIELGTNLGISTSYFASVSSSIQVTTVEGDAQIYKEARNIFKKQKLKNINAIHAQFDDVLSELPDSQMVFIDGNHKESTTIKYAEYFIENHKGLKFLILDDIHWSKGMEKAWEHIKKLPEVSISIDLFYMGIIILNEKNLSPIDLTYIPYKYKFFRAGFY